MNDEIAKEEPNAEMRKLGTMFRQLYIGLVHAGFSEKQALTLLSDMMKTVITAQMQKDD